MTTWWWRRGRRHRWRTYGRRLFDHSCLSLLYWRSILHVLSRGHCWWCCGRQYRRRRRERTLFRLDPFHTQQVVSLIYKWRQACVLIIVFGGIEKKKSLMWVHCCCCCCGWMSKLMFFHYFLFLNIFGVHCFESIYISSICSESCQRRDDGNFSSSSQKALFWTELNFLFHIKTFFVYTPRGDLSVHRRLFFVCVNLVRRRCDFMYDHAWNVLGDIIRPNYNKYISMSKNDLFERSIRWPKVWIVSSKGQIIHELTKHDLSKQSSQRFNRLIVLQYNISCSAAHKNLGVRNFEIMHSKRVHLCGWMLVDVGLFEVFHNLILTGQWDWNSLSMICIMIQWHSISFFGWSKVVVYT